MTTIEVRTRKREELVDITEEVRKGVAEAGAMKGACIVFVPHTTAAVTINEGADPDVREDILASLRHLVPDAFPWRHGEGNSPAHVKACLVGSSVTILIGEGGPRLGTWQSVYLCEFDGPRRREVHIAIIPG